MKLRDLVKKLAAKPNQDVEVDHVVYEQETTNIVSLDMSGPATTAVMHAFGKANLKRMRKAQKGGG